MTKYNSLIAISTLKRESGTNVVRAHLKDTPNSGGFAEFHVWGDN